MLETRACRWTKHVLSLGSVLAALSGGTHCFCCAPCCCRHAACKSCLLMRTQPWPLWAQVVRHPGRRLGARRWHPRLCPGQRPRQRQGHCDGTPSSGQALLATPPGRQRRRRWRWQQRHQLGGVAGASLQRCDPPNGDARHSGGPRAPEKPSGRWRRQQQQQPAAAQRRCAARLSGSRVFEDYCRCGGCPAWAAGTLARQQQQRQQQRQQQQQWQPWGAGRWRTAHAARAVHRRGRRQPAALPGPPLPLHG